LTENERTPVKNEGEEVDIFLWTGSVLYLFSQQRELKINPRGIQLLFSPDDKLMINRNKCS